MDTPRDRAANEYRSIPKGTPAHEAAARVVRAFLDGVECSVGCQGHYADDRRDWNDHSDFCYRHGALQMLDQLGVD